jgi:hypothetical protein
MRRVRVRGTGQKKCVSSSLCPCSRVYWTIGPYAVYSAMHGIWPNGPIYSRTALVPFTSWGIKQLFADLMYGDKGDHAKIEARMIRDTNERRSCPIQGTSLCWVVRTYQYRVLTNDTVFGVLGVEATSCYSTFRKSPKLP